MIDDDVLVNREGDATSSTLLVGVKAGESHAWERFVTLYRPLVLYWCQHGGLQPTDAEDVTQEVFKAVIGAIDRFQHDQPGHSLRGWLRTITRNKVRDHARLAARQAPAAGGSDAQRSLLDLPDRLPESDQGPDPAEEQILLRQALELILAAFKDHTRQAFWRVVVDGQKPEEVARELNLQVHSVYLAKSRVLSRLQKEFGGLVDQNWEPDSDAGGPD